MTNESSMEVPHETLRVSLLRRAGTELGIGRGNSSTNRDAFSGSRAFFSRSLDGSGTPYTCIICRAGCSSAFGMLPAPRISAEDIIRRAKSIACCAFLSLIVREMAALCIPTNIADADARITRAKSTSIKVKPPCCRVVSSCFTCRVSI